MQLNKFKIMILLILVCLTACAKRSLSEKLAVTTKVEIQDLETQIKISSCKNNEKELFYKKLDKIRDNVNLINNSCKMEKSLLKEKITKMKLLFLFILCALLIMKGKNYV